MKPFIARIASIVLLVIATGFFPRPAFSAADPDANAGHLRMALVSMKSLYCDGPDHRINRDHLEANLKRHIYFVNKLADEGVEFVAFPEMSLSGYHFSDKLPWLPLDSLEVEALKESRRSRRLHRLRPGSGRRRRKASQCHDRRRSARQHHRQPITRSP